jgi:hypothetical protein
MKALQSFIGLCRRSSTELAMTAARNVRESLRSYSIKRRSANDTSLLDRARTHVPLRCETDIEGQFRVAGRFRSLMRSVGLPQVGHMVCDLHPTRFVVVAVAGHLSRSRRLTGSAGATKAQS